MIATSYEQWLADGRPWRPAPVIAAFAALMRSYGCTVYEIGDENHLTAAVPEDHTPYSHTSWPDSQPYPLIMALDVMPPAAHILNLREWQALGERIVHDRVASLPGTEWIKYVNFTDTYGACWHASWMPDYAIRPSTDRGHIHISARTDFAQLRDLAGWDPLAAVLTSSTPAPAPAPQPSGDDMLTHWITIKRGDRGEAVRAAQGLLIARGLPVGSRDGKPDGDFGPTTEASTQTLQRRGGIVVDGHFGPHTLSVALYGRDLAA